MTVSRLDAKRRLVLSKDIVNEYGEEFVIVKLPGEILLKPLPKNPLTTLLEEGKKLKGVTVKRLRREFEEDLKGRV